MKAASALGPVGVLLLGVTRAHLQPALQRAGITKPFRAFYDLRHTALTHEAAARNPLVYVQMKAGQSQSQVTERNIHAAQVMCPVLRPRGRRGCSRSPRVRR